MASKDAGFTLIEAMAVAAILAISLTFGVPALSGTLERQRLAASLHLVSADLAMARSSAIMRREQVVVCPGQPGAGCSNDHDWSRGWLVFRDPDGNRQPDAADDLLRVSQAPAGGADRLRLTSTRPWLRYQANGMAAHSNLTVNACARGQLRGKVVVNRLGRVRTERPTRETACP
ncbi:GspH/FimT family pseudopilin [Luteimonas sp. A534]